MRKWVQIPPGASAGCAVLDRDSATKLLENIENELTVIGYVFDDVTAVWNKPDGQAFVSREAIYSGIAVFGEAAVQTIYDIAVAEKTW